jgi:hypothetical protein
MPDYFVIFFLKLAWWCMPVISLSSRRAEARGSQVQGQPGFQSELLTQKTNLSTNQPPNQPAS